MKHIENVASLVVILVLLCCYAVPQCKNFVYMRDVAARKYWQGENMTLTYG